MLTGCTPWPQEFAQRYKSAGYWPDMTLGDLLRRSADSFGPEIAVVEDDRRVSYRALDHRVDRFAAGLREQGINAGDRVVVHLPTTVEFIVASLALFRLGALPVFALPAHRSTEIVHLCRMSDAVAYLVPDQFQGFDYVALARVVQQSCPTVRTVLVSGVSSEYTAFADVDADPVDLPRPDPFDVALFLLSGGTTGLPKLIPRTHSDYIYNATASAELCGLDQDTRYLVALPVAHNFPLACPGVLGVLATGGRVVLTNNPSPESAFALIEREKVTMTALVPPLAAVWTEAVEWLEHDLTSLRLLQVGGAKLPVEVARRVEPALGCRLQQVFGMAEGLLNYTELDAAEDVILSTQGRPLSPADEIHVVDDEDKDVEQGAIGHLLTRGPYTLRGYYRADEHNKSAFTDDGFYRTGDLVRLTATGHLVVEGRVKDVINRGGDKVSAEEVEEHLAAHSGIREAAVVAAPDPIMGERTCAFIVPKEGKAPDVRTLAAFLSERGVAAYKAPDLVRVVDTLPRTGVGKIDKKALRLQVSES
ncbi:hypothetical protein ADK67_21785 [Saccharothrix sp. NRRL B-16348]|uniref:(2,3-dihydroxybenzoyl)adenylate synthase n=1 Tax=Saccharothrix sp. NRRL B-16348 TaxID=1415542 RepID=UPI0006AFC192|nr:AMP-binding protein [Saccharothrix sp. NRRL B-16348]KOX23230.1 hypothetical protein ADK67_21785 [Saccharothrix sp. NRRL B-16348]